MAAFNKALAESDDEPATGAFSSRKKKAEEAEEAPAAEADAPEAEAPEAEDAASDEA